MNILLFIMLFFIVILLYNKKEFFLFSFLYTTYWFLNILFAEVFFSDYKFSELTYVLIIFSCISIFIGELLGTTKINKIENIKFSKNRLYTFIYVSFLIGLIFPIESLIINGISLSTLVSFQNLLEANNTMAVARYSEDLKTSTLSQITLIFLYLSPLLAGFTNCKYKSNKIVIISLLPSLLVLLTQNTKLVFVACLLLVLVGRLTYFIVFKNRFPKISFKLLLKVIVGFFLFYVLMIFTFIARVGKFDENVVNESNSKIATYFAHLPTLSSWLENYYQSEHHELLYGVETFFGIANFLGIAERKIGIFKDNHIFISNGTVFESNIYSSFRFHIDDFGFLGCLLFLFFLGFIFGRAKSSSSSLISVCIIACLIFYTFNSYVSSIWAYLSFILLFVFFYIFLLLSKTK